MKNNVINIKRMVMISVIVVSILSSYGFGYYNASNDISFLFSITDAKNHLAILEYLDNHKYEEIEMLSARELSVNMVALDDILKVEWNIFKMPSRLWLYSEVAFCNIEKRESIEKIKEIYRKRTEKEKMGSE